MRALELNKHMPPMFSFALKNLAEHFSIDKDRDLSVCSPSSASSYMSASGFQFDSSFAASQA